MKSDETKLGLGRRLWIAVQAILWFVLTGLALLGLLAIANWATWVPVALVAIGFLIAVPVYLVRRAFASDKTRVGWLKSYVPMALASTLVLLALAGLPIYYLALRAENRPLIAPQVTLTDGQRTLVLQGMSHVGSEEFYKSVVYDLENALTQGFTLFYEGVQRSPGEGDAWFSTYLAQGGNLSENYKALSGVCGLRFQLDYFTLLEADRAEHPGRHVAADVSALDMKREFDRLAAEDPGFKQWAETEAGASKGKGGDPSLAQIVGFLKDSTPGQRQIAGILCRGVFSIALQPAHQGDGKGEGESQGEGRATYSMSPVILDFRNRALVERIVNSDAQKIYVTYGAEHIPGLLTLLEDQPKPWKVLSAKWSRALSEPREYQGRPLPGYLPGKV
jgi:hypothetical protein